MKTEPTEVLADITEYYSSTLARHGPTPQGVDWNGEESQLIRFEQLTKVVDEPDGFSLLDLGCGYGALHDFLKVSFTDFNYCGYDVSADMIRAARERLKDDPRVKLVHGSRPKEPVDYAVASGIFSVRLQNDDSIWQRYIDDTLDLLNAIGRRGFAFNCLTVYSDKERMQDKLYYADPAVLFDRCKRRYSRQVAVLHDYDLYEFTIIVRK